MTTSKPSVLALSQLSEAVQAGIVLALEERAASDVQGGALASTSPLLPVIVMGYIAPPPREPFAF